MRLKLNPEEALQIQVMDWMRIAYPEHYNDTYHFANERKCSPIRGYILKRMGVKAGVSDLFIDVSRGTYRGLWIEFKIGKNKPTKPQQTFLERKSSQGYCTVLLYDFDAAKAFIEAYFRIV